MEAGAHRDGQLVGGHERQRPRLQVGGSVRLTPPDVEVRHLQTLHRPSSPTTPVLESTRQPGQEPVLGSVQVTEAAGE